MAMLKETLLTRKFNDLRGLNAVTFTVEDGEITAPLQPISRGETLRLRAIGGIELLDSGQVMCNGAAAMDLYVFTVTG